MTETEQNNLSKYMPNYATEVLIYIFSFLEPYHLIKCRQVCSRWKLIVDSLCRKEVLWKRSCRSDFPDIYLTAYYKRKPDLSWRNLYRSLSLWSKLHNATETRDEFASATQFTGEIRDFTVLRGGEIGVHTRSGIEYYNITTLQRSHRGMIQGDYSRYFENDDVILILGLTLHLYVIRKFKTPHQDESTLIPSVKNFLMHNNEVYYVTMENEIYKCDLTNDKITSSLLAQMSDDVMCLGYKNGLHVLMYQRNICTIVGKKIISQNMLDEAPNLLHALNEYNFLDNLDWRVYFQWMHILRRKIPRGTIRNVIIVKVYRDIVFVGSDSGVLRIYHSPYLNNEFDLFNTQPVKQYNFAERRDCPVLTMCPIIQIDVIEGVDSHTVLVAMPKKIVVLDFSHDIGKNLLHFSEIQSIETDS